MDQTPRSFAAHAAHQHGDRADRPFATAAHVSGLGWFAAGTLIDTNLGQRRVERLARGDKVWTADAGFQPIRWIAARKVSKADQEADMTLRPVCLQAGALGPGCPAQDLYLSQQQRVCITGLQAVVLFGAQPVLKAAQALVNDQSVRIMPPSDDVTFVHFLLDRHHIVRANGQESESSNSGKGVLCDMAQGLTMTDTRADGGQLAR